ncbi:MAG: hypothetical protein IJ608_07465 [Lachnospiraceae bacterium]|nr:hypothetical protein [Lachnospiraceae bacterium]
MKKKYAGAAISFFCALLMAAVVYKKCGIYFETNDDRYIAGMLSGTVSGYANPHTYVLSPAIGAIISALYAITDSLPWYGLLLCLLHIFSYGIIIFKICNAEKNRLLGLTKGILVVASLALSALYTIGKLEFTSTAIVLAAVGYFCLIYDKEKGFKWFVVFEFLSIFTRFGSMLMVQPLGMAAYAGVVLTDQESGVFFARTHIRKCIFRVIKALIVVLGAIALLGFTKLIFGEASGEWLEYYRHDIPRGNIFDQYSRPSYDDIKDILDRYGVSRNRYEAYCEYLITEYMPEGLEEEIEKFGASLPENDMSDALYDHLKNLNLFKSKWDLNLPMFVVIGALTIWIIISRRYKCLIPLLFSLCGYSIIWLYLFYIDRVLLRVTAGVYAAGLMIFISLFIYDVTDNTDILKKRIIWGIFLMMLLLASFRTGRQQYRYLKQENEGQEIYMQGLYELTDYCDSHTENKYLIDGNAVTYYHGSAFETYTYGVHNYRLSGGWFSYMPSVQKGLREYFEGVREFYYIIYSDGNEENRATMRYLEELTGAEPIKADVIPLSPGGECAVYRFEGNIY